MPVPQAAFPTAAAPRTRKTFVPYGSLLRPLYTHGTPSATPHTSTLLLPCNASGFVLSADGVPSQLCPTLPHSEDHTTALALSPTGEHAVHALRSGRVLLHHLPTSESHALLPASDQQVISHLAFDASGAYVALASADGKVRVYNVETAAPTHEYDGATSNAMLSAIAFHPVPDEASLLLAAEDGVVRKCDLGHSRAKPVVVAERHVSSVVSFAFADDNGVVVTAGADKLLCFAKWPAMADAKLVSTDERIFAVVRPGGDQTRFVLSVGERGIIRRWDARTGREDVGGQFVLPFVSRAEADEKEKSDVDDADDDFQSPVQPISMTMCGPLQLVIALSDQTLLYVTVSEVGLPLKVRKVICGNLEEIYDVRVLPKRKDTGNPSSAERRDVAVASNSAVLWIVSMTTSLAARSEKEVTRDTSDRTVDEKTNHSGNWSCHAGLTGHSGIILAVDALTSSKATGKDNVFDAFLATSSRDKTARVWCRSRSSGLWNCMAVAEGHTDAVGAVAISPRATTGQFFIVTGSADRTIKKWSLDAAQKCEELRRAERASISNSSEVRLTKTDGKAVELSATWTTLAHGKDVNAVAISPDANLVATGSQDRLVKLWDAAKGTIRFTCSGHRRGVWNVAFSNVDRILASCSADSTVRVWNVATGVCLRSLEGHLSGVLRCVFMSTGTQVASAGSDGLLKLWLTRSGECISTIDAHDDRVWALDKIDDGNVLLSAGSDGLARMWRDATEEEALAAVEKREEDALMEQEVQNAARVGNWSTAARGALKLGMTRKLRSVVMDLITKSEDAEGELMRMVAALRTESEEVASENDGWALVTRMFLCCRDWNASGGTKNAAVASRVLRALFSLWTPETLCESLNVDKRALVEALNAHCSRHLERVSQFASKVAVLEHTLHQMRALGELDNRAHGQKKKMPVQKREAVCASEGEDEGAKEKLTRKRKRREDFPSEY